MFYKKKKGLKKLTKNFFCLFEVPYNPDFMKEISYDCFYKWQRPFIEGSILSSHKTFFFFFKH